MTVAPPTAVPAWATGAWIRRERAIGDEPPLECSDVVWLQVGPWFADLRLPRPGRDALHAYDAAHAFSGRLEVASVTGTCARVTWHHDLDTVVHDDTSDGVHDDTSDGVDDDTSDGVDDDSDRGPDSADIEVRDDVLIESGTGYVEWWARPEHRPVGPDGTPGAGHVLLRGDGSEDPDFARIVCVDGMAVAVWAGPTPGGAWCSAAGGWEPSRVVGVVPAGFDIGTTLRAIVGGGPPVAGWWREEAR